MAYFESGVARYIKAYAVIEVAFPVDFKGNSEICCFRRCPFYMENWGRCSITQELIPYPKTNVGDDCPLMLKEEEE